MSPELEARIEETCDRITDLLVTLGDDEAYPAIVLFVACYLLDRAEKRVAADRTLDKIRTSGGQVVNFARAVTERITTIIADENKMVKP